MAAARRMVSCPSFWLLVVMMWLCESGRLPTIQTGLTPGGESGLLGQPGTPRSQLGPWIIAEHVGNSAPHSSAGLTHGAASPENAHGSRYCSQAGGRLHTDKRTKPVSKLAELCLKTQGLVLRATSRLLLHAHLSPPGFWFLPWQRSVVSLAGVPFTQVTASLRECSAPPTHTHD